MRRILSDHARAAQGGKRSGPQHRVELEAAGQVPVQRPEELLALDQAPPRLEALYPRASRVVELRFFAGLTEQEAAQALKVSLTTIKRDWLFARLWLCQPMKDEVGMQEDG